LKPVWYKRSNLDVVTGAMVTKVLIDPNTNEAYGVEFAHKSDIRAVHAMKEVILCAGVINSPQLFQLPGVGPSELLDSLGIFVIKNMKVGYNFEDHFLPIPFVKMKLQNTATVPHTLEDILEDVEEYKKFRNGSFSGLVEVTGFTFSSNATDGITDTNIMFYTSFRQEPNTCCPKYK
jgi:choline dehydrogenase-like flavoprotein